MAANLAVEALVLIVRVVRSDLKPHVFKQLGEGEKVGPGDLEPLGDRGQLLAASVDGAIKRCVHVGGCGLVTVGVVGSFDRQPQTLCARVHQVRRKVGAAARLGGAWQVRGDRVLQIGMRVTRNELSSGRAASDQVSEDRIPFRPGFTGGRLQAEQFAAAVAVDPGRDLHDRVMESAARTGLHRLCVDGDDREGTRPSVRTTTEEAPS